MKVIAEHFNLGDKLINYLKDDKLYYSYAYSMDTINYDERYVKMYRILKDRRMRMYIMWLKQKLKMGIHYCLYCLWAIVKKIG